MDTNNITKEKIEFHKKYIKTKEFDEVRQSVLKRDGYKCVLCGRTDNLVCHHTTYKHLGYHNQKEIDDCITICVKDHLNHHKGKYNIWWYSVDHPRNNDDLRELDVDGEKLLIRSNGKDIYDADTYKKLKFTYRKDADRYVVFINKHTYYVSRLVAQAYPEICGEWFDDCEVHHIDKDRLNNSVWNLKVLSVEDHKKEHLDTFLEKAAGYNNKRIAQYTLSGNLVSIWKSAAEAARGLGLNRGAIGNTFCTDALTSGGYIWKHFEEDDEVPLWIEPVKTAKERSSEKNSIPIQQYDLKGNWIKDWKSVTEAAKYLGCKSVSSINNCLRGRSKSSGGFVWKYKDREDN